MGTFLNWIYQKRAVIAGFILILIIAAGVGLYQRDAVLEIKSIVASKTTYGESRVLYKPENGGFWETQGPFPVSLLIELKRATTITAYQMRSDSNMPEAGNRMPDEWKVFLSGDGREWHEADYRKDAKPWSAAELREYPFKERNKALFVKIEVMNTPAGNLLRVARVALR